MPPWPQKHSIFVWTGVQGIAVDEGQRRCALHTAELTFLKCGVYIRCRHKKVSTCSNKRSCSMPAAEKFHAMIMTRNALDWVRDRKH